MKQDQKIKRGIVVAVVVAPVASLFGAACSAGGGNPEGPGGFSGNNQGGNAGTVLFGGNTGTSGTTGTGSVTFMNGGTSTNGGAQGTGGFVANTANAPLPPQVDRCMGQAAQFGGGSGSGITYTYPYEGTVFPRGILSPPLMWNQGGSADAVMLKMQSQKFTYQECFGATNPLRITIPQDAWDSAGFYSNGPSDPLTVTLTVLSGGQVIGPVNETLLFAQAAIKGAIYYNTYDSPLTGNVGGILKILPSQPTPVPFLTTTGLWPVGPCISCHSLSVNGSTMTANNHSYPAGPFLSMSYDVTGPTPTQVQGNLPEAGFAGIYPDGSILMTNGARATTPNPSRSPWFPDNAGIPAAISGPPQGQTTPITSHVLDTRTGQPVPTNGWNVTQATMPTFSPDGKHIAYNNFEKGGGHTLWMQDFDYATKTFSGERQVYNDATLYPGWPFFTPDSKQVYFGVTSRDDFASQIPDYVIPPPALQPCGTGHLMIVDVSNPAQAGPAVKLDLAGGFRNGQSYLPGNDNDREFYPTMSPIAAGGFFWAFFTSRRSIGNLQTLSVEEPKAKKLWVTALSMGAPAGSDPSHPAFFLPGQEMNTGNMRAFAALEPCKEDGEKCTSGTDCCRGFCGDIKSDGIGTCGAQPPNACAKENDKCTQDSDCCPPASGARALICLGGFCVQEGIH